jgi:hypothetical protein
VAHEDFDPGIDKQKLLDEIVGASFPPEGGSPPPLVLLTPAAPPQAVEEAKPAPPATDASPFPEVPVPMPKAVGARSTKGVGFRSGISAFVLLVAGSAWAALGAALGDWGSGGLGVGFGLAGVLVLARERLLAD